MVSHCGLDKVSGVVDLSGILYVVANLGEC
jgi:hypothetical protein